MDDIKAALRDPFVSKLTAEESADLYSHISHTRASIFELERRINVFSGKFGIFDLPRAIADLEESSSHVSQDQQDILRQQNLKRNTTFPIKLVERPVFMPDSERTIFSPRSLNRVFIRVLKMTVEGCYHLLKVKKQELKLEMDKLEADVKRCGDIYTHMTSSEARSPLEEQPKQPLSTSSSFSSSHSTPRNLVRRRSRLLRLQGGIWDLQG
ncbi:hypothetical protein DL95DRAFT_471582 [Leptodontidium sp. 2 PMI_412]|nr:hypothetical protein DL95DRAFT_471582 [Leptodontidium sp. 2 PMI_412]